jgi:hypothetical protein
LGSKSKVSASDAGIEIGQLENNKFGFEKDPKNLKATISIQEMTKVSLKFINIYKKIYKSLKKLL